MEKIEEKMNMDIVYEDNHVIAINKPVGIAVQAAEKGEVDLFEAVKAFIKERDKKPGNVFIGLVHRIDRPVSGIVLFAKTSKAASRLSEQMRDGKIYKQYEAVVHGRMPAKKGRLVNFLSKLKQNRGYKAVVVQRGGEKAVLDYEVIEDGDKYSRLKVVLDTGRFHQIRAQLAETGHAIVGDSLYGSKEKLEHNEIKLRAVRCAFNHVVSNERIELEIKGFAC
jgi:23S rRNA pseudouridine1911/1915/1917 synthase